MPSFKDLTGKRFGRLVAVGVSDHRAKDKTILWDCVCDCGNTCTVRARSLVDGSTKSCGCLKRDSDHAQKKHYVHGGTDTHLHKLWRGMKARCHNRNATNYRYYGGRGICVCDEWQNDFTPFRDWAMSHGYQEGLSIDRIDPDGNYCPENCRWITMAEQQRNKRNSKREA